MPEFVSFAELNPTLNHLNKVQDQYQEANPPLAKKALQFYFSGMTGFKFPVCHLPVNGVNSDELLHLTLSVITALQKYSFQVFTLTTLYTESIHQH